MLIMLILITYDICTNTQEGKNRLHKVAKICENYGQRVQSSVFECLIDNAQLTKLKVSLKQIIDVETDSLRIYTLGNEYKDKIIHIGTKTIRNMNDTLIL